MSSRAVRSLALFGALAVAVAGCGLVTTPAPTPGPELATAGTSPSPSPSAAPSPSAEPSPTAVPSPTAPPTFPPLGTGIVPILYLHRVEAPPAAWTTWTPVQRLRFLGYDDLPAAFAAQLDWLAANGYTTILPRDLAAHWDHGAPLPARPVIISFDDGDPSWTQTVLPLLQAHHMVAEFYLTLTAIANDSISWTEVRTLAAAGMGIGAHDVHHVQLAGLPAPETPAPSPVMWTEISNARTIIGREVGTLPDSMAYVGGGFDPELESLVPLAGYTTARSIIRGIAQSVSSRYTLRVIAVVEHDDVIDSFTGELVPGLPVFAAKMAGTQQ